MFDTVRARLRKHRTRPPRARRLGIERLEGRDVPATLNPLALLPGEVTAPRQPDWVQMQVETNSPRALLTFETDATDGSAFVPGRVSVFAGAGAHVGSPGMVSRPGYSLRAVSSGMFFARVAAARASTGAYNLSVGLAGDVNGDHQVDAQDLDAIRALWGTRAGQAGYDPAADVNHNGVIGSGDVALARRNLGVTVTAGPLTADQFLFAGSDALARDGQARVTLPTPRFSLVIPDIQNGTPIEVESFSWAVAHTLGAAPSSADFNFTKHTDAASPKLFLACATGQTFLDMTLSVKRAGVSSPVILQWELSDVLVSSYQVAGSAGGLTNSLEEAVSLTFRQIKMTFTPILPTGKLGTPVTAGFDFATDKTF
jgi:type VI secretion system secreted protein Hcp